MEHKQGQAYTSAWTNPLMRCSPFGALCKAYCWPCTSYAETEQLLRDPSVPVEKNSRDYVEFGRDFCIGTYASKLGAQRATIRARYAIPGTSGNDCLVSCCCWACVVMQHDEEVRARLEKGDRGQGAGPAGGVVTGGYERQGGMVVGNEGGGGGGGVGADANADANTGGLGPGGFAGRG